MFAGALIRDSTALSSQPAGGGGGGGASTEYLALYDRVDRLNTLLTPILVGVCLTIVTSATFYLSPLACIATTIFEGPRTKEYIQSYCLVHGTIPLAADQELPQELEAWKQLDAEQRITYYQYMPFFLLALALLFHLPYYLWQALCHNRIGIDYVLILGTLSKIPTLSATDQEAAEKELSTSANALFSMLCFTRERIDFTKLYLSRASLSARLRYRLSHTLFFNKLLNRCLTLGYLGFKLLLLGLAVAALRVCAHFFHSREHSFLGLGWHILTNSLLPRQRQHQGGEHYDAISWFPRVAFCLVQYRVTGLSGNHIVAQCALNVNMVNEKVCLFLAGWFALLLLVNFTACVTWTVRCVWLPRREAYVRGLLLRKSNEKRLEEFYRSLIPVAADESAQTKEQQTDASNEITTSSTLSSQLFHKPKQKRDGNDGEGEGDGDAETHASVAHESHAHSESELLLDQEFTIDKDLDRYFNGFVVKFLKQDGIFVLRMIDSQVGSYMTGRFVLELWKLFLTSVKDPSLPNFENTENNFNLNIFSKFKNIDTVDHASFI